MTENTGAKENKWRTPVALAVSGGWFTLALCWTFYRPCGAWAIPAMDPNAWGDWAAGTFAPLAFLWLVVGYFQQGEELRGNVKALHLQERALQLQVQELRESVEQQTATARAASRQADMLEKSQVLALRAQVLEHQPRLTGFRVLTSNQAERILVFACLNQGHGCHDVLVSRLPMSSDPVEAFPLIIGYWFTGTEQRFTFNLADLAERFMTLEVGYRDALLVSQTQFFHVSLDPWPRPESGLTVSLERMTFNIPTAHDGSR